MYLGLDLSLTSTGVCLLTSPYRVRTFTIKTGALRGVARLAAIKAELTRVLTEPGSFYTLAAIEGYSFGSIHRLADLGELSGMVRVLLHEHNVPFVIVPPKSAKKFLTGKGDADKIAVAETCLLEYGHDFLREWQGLYTGAYKPIAWGSKDEHWRTDEADAFAMAYCAWCLGGDSDVVLKPYQQTILDGLRIDSEGVMTRKRKTRLLKAAKGTR